MRRELLLICVLLIATAASAQRPNPRLTPGKARTTSRTEICDSRFHTRQYRHTTRALKIRVCRAYGIEHCPDGSRIEIDHLIPLELGGADVFENLWPELAGYTSGGPGFHVKDRLENYLRDQVCSGKMTLPAAQHCIARDWVQCAKRMRKR